MVYGYGKYKISDPSGKRNGTDIQYDSWEEHLVMVLILYDLFYVLLVRLHFFDSFKQNKNLLNQNWNWVSGKKEREESGKWTESTNQRLWGFFLHQVNLSVLSVFFFKLRLFVFCFYQAIGKVYDEFYKFISLFLYGSDLMISGGRKHLA